MQVSSSHCWSQAVHAVPYQSLLLASISFGLSSLAKSLAVYTGLYLYAVHSQSVLLACSLVISISLTWSLAENASLSQSLVVSSSLCWTLYMSAARLQSLVVSIILIWSLQFMLVSTSIYWSLLVNSSHCWSRLQSLVVSISLIDLYQYLLVYASQ